MAAPRAKTLQQTLGFVDEDLKRNSHDEIISWCQKNAKNIITETLLEDYTEKHIDSIKTHLLSALNMRFVKKDNGISYRPQYYSKTSDQFSMSDLSFGKPIEKRSNVSIINITWEYLIRSHNKNTRTGYDNSKDIGFIDLLITASIPSLSFEGVSIERNTDGSISFVEIGDRDNLNFNFNEQYYQLNFLVEAKTRMPTLGELFRQLNLYKQYRPNDKFIVVCPDDSKKSIIEEQGFYFTKCQ
ncbi:MAG: hypothetical protein ABJF04_09380 [Reichenbachiella sp.]|uniref:hypothetical protein n=1 Tax=Reichenbachiella sp. TaxID=2184521 RepID=UPI003263EDEF